MPDPNRAVPSSRAKVFVVPPAGGQPILLGIVEDFSPGEIFASENLNSIGDFVPPDNVINQKEGRFSWGRVHKLDQSILATIAPTVSEFATYQAFDILAVDPADGKPIVRCVDCLPTALNINMTNGRALRENYQGICRYIQHGQDVLQAA